MKQKRVNMLPLFRQFLTSSALLLLAGCSSSLSDHRAPSHGAMKNIPEQQVTDFLATDCEDIWSLSGDIAERNPLYWLRGIDCASRLSASAAREEARQHTQQSWQGTFLRGILLASARITPPERRNIVNQADSFSGHIPGHVRGVYQLWRESQLQQLQLADTRTRYSQLQQSTDAELDAMRTQQQTLREALALTTRKLENLTDIERQLSSRKPVGGSLLPDSSRADDTQHDAGSDIKEK